MPFAPLHWRRRKVLIFFPAKSTTLGIVQSSLALLSSARFVISGELVSEKLINIAKLFNEKLVPALRHVEVDCYCLYIKSAITYCTNVR